MGLRAQVVSNTEAVLAFADEDAYRADGSMAPVLWLHASGDDHLEPITLQSGAALPIIRAICELGFPVVSPLCDTTTHWGRDGAQTKALAALTWARSSFGASQTKPAIGCGVSMGALLGLLLRLNNPTLVQALALFYPAVNLVAHHDATGGSSDFSAAIEGAGGYGSNAAYLAAAAAHDPAQHASSFTGVPIAMWRSTADTAVGTANQDVFAAAVGGSAFETHSLGASSHPDLTVPSPSDVASFMLRFA